MLDKALQILNNMYEDENVLALKNIISSYVNSTKIYMLRYKGKPVTFYITNHDADFSNGSTVYLDTDSTQPMWTTTDLTTAIYAKYISTEWYNSSMETPTHQYKWDPQDIEVVDNFGKVYNRKLLSNRTYAILKAKVMQDKEYLNFLEDEEWCKKPVHCLWQQKTFLQEVKQKIQMAGGIVNLQKVSSLSLYDLYAARKGLVKRIGEGVKKGHACKMLKKKLESVNKAIAKKGGK